MIQLYLDGKLCDVDGGIDIPLTFQYEDLNNPTLKKNSFSKTVQLPASNTNNEIFNHIYRLDHLIFDFDPLKRVDFVLCWNNTIIESGYFKLNSIDYYGQYPRTYNITLYGGIGDFFYTLSEKFMNELKVNPNNYNHVIDRNSIVNSWTNQYYRYFLTYSGAYDNFDSDKIFTSFSDSINNIISIATNGSTVFVLANNGYYLSSDGITYTFYSNATITTFPEKLSSDNGVKYDDVSGRYIVYIGRYIYHTSTPATDSWVRYEGFTTPIFDISITNSTTATYYIITTNGVVWKMRNFPSNPQLTSYNSIGTFDFNSTISMWNNTQYDTGIITTRSDVYKITSSNVTQAFAFGTIPRSQFNNQYPTSSWALSTRTSPDIVAFGTNTVNNVGGFYFRSKDFDDFDNIAFNSIFRTVANMTNGISYLNNELYCYGNNGKIIRVYNFDAGGTYNVVTTNNIDDFDIRNIIYFNNIYVAQLQLATNFTYLGYSTNLRDWTVIQGSYEETDSIEFDEHERNEFRSYYQRPGLRFKELFLQILEDSGFNYSLDHSFFNDNNPYWSDTWVLMNRLKFIDEPPIDHAGNIRSYDEITFENIIDSNTTQFDFFINYIKIFGLYVESDKINNQILIKSRNTYFSNYEIEDWTSKIDLAKTLSIEPLTFDYRYGLFEYQNTGSYYEERYEENNNITYGSTRVDTGYEFDNSEIEYIPNNIYSNVVMSREYSRYFEGRLPGDLYANDKILPALYTKSENRWTYNESSYMLVFSTGLLTANEEIRITDDNPDMLNLGIFMWNNTDRDSILRTNYPECSRLIEKNGTYYSFDFGRPSTLYYTNLNNNDNYPDSATIYSRFWNNYLAERLNSNNKIANIYAYLNYIDINNFTFRKFIEINDTLWHVNIINSYNINKEQSTQLEIVRVYDINNYINSQNI